MPQCTECNDLKHIQDSNGNWVRCDACFNRTKVEFRAQVLPDHMRGHTLDDLRKSSLFSESAEYVEVVLGRLEHNTFPKKFLYFIGKQGLDKLPLLKAIIYTATIKGISVERKSLSEIVDSYFSDTKEAWKATISDRYRLLVLQMGGEIQNSAILPILKSLIEERQWKAGYTIIVADQVQRPKEFNEFLASERFKKIVI